MIMSKSVMPSTWLFLYLISTTVSRKLYPHTQLRFSWPPSRRKQYFRKTEIRRVVSQVQIIWDTKYKNSPSSEHQPPPSNKKGKERQGKSPLDKILDELDAPVDPMID